MRIGAPDLSLTAVAGISELVERLEVIALLDAAIESIKQRARGHGAGQSLVGLAAAQLAGEAHLVGLDRHRADRPGQALTPVPGLGSRLRRGDFSQFEPAFGLLPGGGAAQHLARLMGRARALEVMLSAQDYDAELAERYGWVNRAVPADELDDFVRSLAHRIARFPATGHITVKDRVIPSRSHRRRASAAIPIFSARQCAPPRCKAESEPR